MKSPEELMKELKEDEWYQTRPQIIKDAIDILPPTRYYMFKDSKKECYIISYDEPENGKVEDVTVMVQKTGVGGPMAEMGLSMLDTNKVFGVALTDLEPSTYKHEEE